MTSEARFVTSTLSDERRVEEPSRTRDGIAIPAARGTGVVPHPRETVESQAYLLVSRGPEAGHRFVLTQEPISFGRHRESDVFLDDVTVSRHHAQILREEERYVLVDVGSLNGTYLNREPIERAELTDGDEIWIGKARFVFRAEG
ncbi:FHA domain-containing protein [Parasphingorhabdus pacifica]